MNAIWIAIASISVTGLVFGLIRCWLRLPPFRKATAGA